MVVIVVVMQHFPVVSVAVLLLVEMVVVTWHLLFVSVAVVMVV